MFIFILVSAGSRDRFSDGRTLVSALRCFAGLGGIPDVSCRNDVQDILALELEEPVDTPGTTIGTNFQCCMESFCHFGLTAVFDHWPPHMSIHVLRRACLPTRLQACLRGFAPSRRAQGRERIVASSFVCTSPKVLDL